MVISVVINVVVNVVINVVINGKNEDRDAVIV